MNKVIRFQGNTNTITKEPGYFYIANNKAVFIDQNKKQITFANESTTENINKTIESNAGDFSVLVNKIAMLEEQMLALKTKDAVAVTDAENLNQADQDLVIAIEEPVSAKTNIAGKSITVKQMSVASGTVSAVATQDVNFSNVSTDGNLVKGVSNSQININTNGYVKVANCELKQTSYNGIEIGLSKTTKSVVIDNIIFDAQLANNAISIFDTQDNATITISNCIFKDCSNPLRISNRSGNKVVVNIINCEFTKWDSRPNYAGCVICQDYTSTTASLAQSNNLFAPDKVTINFINCTHNGEKIVVEDRAAVCGTHNADTQLLYVYTDREGVIEFGDGNRYPTLTAK